MNKILTIRKFINKQSIYMWMLVSIILFNAVGSILEAISGPGEVKEEEFRVQKKLKEELTSKEEILKILDQKKSIAIILGMASIVGVLVLILGIWLNIRFVVLRFQGKKLIESHLIEHPRASWGIWDVCKVVILFLFVGYLVHIIEAAILPLLSLRRIDNRLRLILNTTLIDGTAFCFIIYFVTRHYKQKVAALGLRSENFLGNIVLGITGYIAVLPILVLILLVVLWISSLLNYSPPPQPVFDLFLEEERMKLLIYSAIFVAVLGPIIEEVFFRGFMYSAIKAKFGIGWAIILTSFLFAGLHTNPVGFLPIMVLGILLAYLYERTGSLVPSITVHILHNFLMVGFLFLMKEIMI